jgi:hypothetical protein
MGIQCFLFSFSIQSVDLHWFPGCINSSSRLLWLDNGSSQKLILSSGDSVNQISNSRNTDEFTKPEDDDEAWLMRSSHIVANEDVDTLAKSVSRPLAPSSASRLKRPRASPVPLASSVNKSNLIKPVIQKTPLRRRNPGTPFRLEEIDESDEFAKRAFHIAMSILPLDTSVVPEPTSLSTAGEQTLKHAYETFTTADQVTSPSSFDQVQSAASSPAPPVVSSSNSSTLTAEMKAAIERKRQIALALLMQKRSAASPSVQAASQLTSPFPANSVTSLPSPAPPFRIPTSTRSPIPFHTNSTPKRGKYAPATPASAQMCLNTPPSKTDSEAPSIVDVDSVCNHLNLQV